MDRRAFLKTTAAVAGTLSAGGLLGACAKGGTQASGTGSAGAAAHAGKAGKADAIPDGEATLAPQIASFELLTGKRRTVPFGLRTVENAAVGRAPVEVFLRDLDGEVLGGPFPTTYTEEAGEGLGLYVSTLDLSQPGDLEFVAVTGDRYGTQVVRVVTPEQSKVQVPGDEAVSVATATTANPRGVKRVCTQQPPCGMHRTSLDTALARGRPVMLLFATPAYCQTTICGPAVSTVDRVRRKGDFGDTAWIHVEIYRDAGQTLSKPVEAWELPTEPWLFSVGADGTIVDRLDGPMLPGRIAGMARALRAGT